MKTILVTGGAGYIGSHVVKALLEKGFKVVVVDNLFNGHREVIDRLDVMVPESQLEFYEADIGDKITMLNILSTHHIDAVLHFAAFIEAGMSMIQPEKFYDNNCVKGFKLLESLRESGVKKFIFSSTAAVYGDPVEIPITEDHPLKPVNYYGWTKLIFEELLDVYDNTHDFEHISLRYFNASGADISGEIGEHHDPETHLIPLVLQVVQGKRDNIKIFGTDYGTKDGTCIRDYIHVLDLADAHVLALEKLLKDGGSHVYNLGNGKGFSVKQVIEGAEKVLGKKINAVDDIRREGDPAILVADSKKAKKELGWNPVYIDIENIIGSAWHWHEKNPEGFVE